MADRRLHGQLVQGALGEFDHQLGVRLSRVLQPGEFEVGQRALFMFTVDSSAFPVGNAILVPDREHPSRDREQEYGDERADDCHRGDRRGRGGWRRGRSRVTAAAS